MDAGIKGSDSSEPLENNQHVMAVQVQRVHHPSSFHFITTMTRRNACQKPSAQDLVPGKFEGLRVSSDGSEPITRNTPPPSGTTSQRKRKLARETLNKVEQDMNRHVLKEVMRAISNPLRLPFRISDFVVRRQQNRIPVFGGSAFENLATESRRLGSDGGPRVVVDEDDVVVLWYFPSFLGHGLQNNILQALSTLTNVYRPPADCEVRDRRGGTQGMERPNLETDPGLLTRGRAAHSKPEVSPESAEEPIDESLSYVSTGEEVIGDSPPAIYSETEGQVRLEVPVCQAKDELGHSKIPSGDSDGAKSLAELEPFAYYFSPGWYQTGMHRVRPMHISLHFRNALEEKSLNQMIQFLEAKRLFDKKVTFLTNIIHPSLCSRLLELKAHMSAVKGPTQVTLLNGWTSAFPCFGVGINRTSGLHRDTRGIRGGLDIIGVLGSFTQGGDLEFPDLNLRLEWTPGSLGAFDGYDFKHKVHSWKGGCRVVLISFCRESTWSGLGLDSTLIRPTRAQCLERLEFMKRLRAASCQQVVKKGSCADGEQEPHRDNTQRGKRPIRGNTPTIDFQDDVCADLLLGTKRCKTTGFL
ncbi:hypothetical protein CTheo_7457 [Ceratobasidium theobromae]|uniref:Uncharacterized protein n=1 Tax=Ceratobasidium theobromae TaxID=1582974 RepID=A0A5N5QBH3_9AGAM|nr:hypothetical protein CTheo_7457 [Ceratobasidium theobromae]